MTQFIQSLASFTLVLGILVFVHEFGHFIVAKAFGIGVPVFSLGFGPRLFGFKRGETDYRISIVPLGGYVRLAGDESDEERIGSPEEFLSRPRWQRLLVFLAGATFNIILAVLVTWLVFWAYGKDEIVPTEAYPVVVAFQEGSTAEAAGLQIGDRLVSVAGRDARLAETLDEEVLLSPETLKEVVIEREGERMTLQLNTGLEPRYHLGYPGWQIIQEGTDPPIIDAVVEGSPAQDVGLEAGDRIVGVDGQEPVQEVRLREILAASPGKEVHLKLERDGKVFQVTVVPRLEDDRGLLGVRFRPAGYVHLELTLGQAFVASLRINLAMTQMVFKTLRKLIRGDISMRVLSGPIEIARVSGEMVRGFQPFLTFLAFISLQLGVLNLLPIPVLDGGHIFILGVEGLIRRDLSDRVKERVMQAGLVFLIAFFGVVIYFDLIKIGS